MDNLRSSMSLRVYAQKDPLVEYKNEAFNIFKDLMDRIYHEVAENLFTEYASFEDIFSNMPLEMQHQLLDQFGASPDGQLVLPPGLEITQEPVAVPGGAPGELPEMAVPEQEVPIQFTYRREEPKIGRNDPCPCGSGKKYKNCCGKVR